MSVEKLAFSKALRLKSLNALYSWVPNKCLLAYFFFQTIFQLSPRLLGPPLFPAY